MSQASVRLAGIDRLQRGRKATLLAVALVGIAIASLVESVWPPDNPVHNTVEWVGVLLVIICIAGRTWCSFYIGGKKVRELITAGPYSVTRNPLYVFSVIGGFGIGAAFGSIVFALATGAIVLAVFYVIARRAERLLAAVHGEAFTRYCEKVPRFFPRFSAWRDSPMLEVETPRVYATFLDSLFFLLVFPLAEGINLLQETRWLSPLVWVP